MIHPQAQQLNDVIAMHQPAVLSLLSRRGKAIYFPSKGLVAQGAEAKGKKINATIGMAFGDDRRPLALPSIASQVNLSPEEVFPYAPSAGIPELRQRWKTELVEKNPDLAGQTFSLPVITNALTHALSMAGYLFLDPGDEILLPDRYYGNYNLVFAQELECTIRTYPLFKGDRLDLEGFAQALRNRPASGKQVVVLNFPHNPTGYTPLEEEAAELARLLIEDADTAGPRVVMLDDAYFGLVFREGVARQSLFTRLCSGSPNLLAVKMDAATKEDYAWGLRVGFITLGIAGGNQPLYDALNAKLAGAIRGNISNAPMISQNLVLRAMSQPGYHQEKAGAEALLRSRFERVCQVLEQHPHYGDCFVPLPFNSGYFLCLRLLRHDAEQIRQVLLREFDTGVIALGDLLRLAFASVPVEDIPQLFENIHQACLKTAEMGK